MTSRSTNTEIKTSSVMTMQQRLLNWFDVHKRRLPWRENRTPYSVWISEIMLQQTRVDTVIPYYESWFKAFPDIHALAASSEQEVLKHWEGLGYYNRARSLHKTAKKIAFEMDGLFPRDEKELQKLPGIGRYTAGAIASIAFGDRVPALDGNIRRIYSRLYDLDLPLKTSEAEKALWLIAEQRLPAKRSGDYHEALMDLGATICLPSSPDCGRCPLTQDCNAFQNGTVAERPVVLPKPKIPHYDVTAAIILREHCAERQVLLAQRPQTGLLGGLWEYPGGKLEPGESLEDCLRREIQEELGVTVIIKAPFGTYRHAYTHFKVTLRAFLCDISSQVPTAIEAQEIRWVSISMLREFPMGKIDRMISAKIEQEAEQVFGTLRL